MASGTNIGNLSFGIGGDDAELRKIFAENQKRALELQRMLGNMSVGTNRSQIQQQQALHNMANRNAISQARLDEIQRRSDDNALIRQQRLERQRLQTEATQQRLTRQVVSGNQAQANSFNLVNQTMFNQKALLNQLTNAMGIYFSIYQAGRFVKELAMVSGEFEKQRISLRAILQDTKKADEIFGQIKDLAVYSPFNFKELTDYAKQLSAFSIPANELYDTMTRLADISAGLGVDMGRIILAYGQVRSASVLRGQELRQFTEAGIPLVDELAKKFSLLEDRVVSAGEVFDKISNREVPFAMIKEIFEDLTNEGGKFYKMQELQATSLAGKISNLRDAYDIMLDSIGKANSGLLHGSVSGLVDVMDNWEKYWRILKSIIIGYGAYKAAVIASTIANKGLLTSIRSLTVAQALLNTVSKANPYALAIAGIVAFGTALYSFAKSQDEAKEALLDNITTINNHAIVINENIDKLKELTKATDENKKSEGERASILAELSRLEPSLANAIKDHADSLERLTDIQEKYNTIVSATKFAKYAISETGGWFDDNLEDKLQKLITKQNEVDLGATKLSTTYSSILETLEQAKNNDGFEHLFGKVDVDEGRMKELETILASKKTQAEKVLEIYDLLNFVSKNNTLHKPESYKFDANVFSRAFSSKQREEVKAYNQTLFELGNITKEVNEDLDGLGATLEGYLKNKDINVFDKVNENMVREFIKSIDNLNEYAQKHLLSTWNIEFETKGTQKGLDGWRKELEDILEGTIPITVDSNIEKVIEDAKKEYKTLFDLVEDGYKSLSQSSFDFANNTFKHPASHAIQQLAESYKANKQDLDNIRELFKSLNINEDELKPKTKGSSKDLYLDNLKKRVELLKDLRSEYEKLTKAGMSEDEASKHLSTLDAFKGLNAKDVSKTIDSIIKELQNKGKLNEGRQSFLESLILGKDKDSIAKEVERITKEAENAVKEIEASLSKHKTQYSIYESLFESTGDKGLSAKLAFDSAEETVKTYREALKQAIDKTNNKDLKKKLEEQLSDLDISETNNFSKQMADLLTKYRTTEEKITAIQSKGEKERQKIREQYLEDDSLMNNLLQKSKENEQKRVDDLKTELFQLTPFYRDLFGNISEYGYRHLERLADKAKDVIKDIANVKDESGKLKYGRYNESGELDGYWMPREDGDVSDTLISLKEYARILKQISSMQTKMRENNPYKSLTRGFEDYEGMEYMDILASKAQDLNTVINGVGNSLSEMFSALGQEDAVVTTEFITDLTSSLATIGEGIASKNPVAIIQGVAQGITSIVNFHDKKLDRAIQKSQLEVKKLENAYTDLSRNIERQLGKVTKEQAKNQVDNLKQQQEELRSQLESEQGKKKQDDGAIEDYKAQINELGDQIKYFYEDLFSDQFGLEIKSMSDQISDSLVGAFASGEDAALAFKKTVGSIINDLASKMISLEVIQPAMDKVRDYLFGDKGVFKDGDLSVTEAQGLVSQLANLKDSVGASKEIWDALNEAAEQAGFSLEDETSNRGTLSKGIQAVTEDTASLLASLINGIRGDVAKEALFIDELRLIMQNNSTTFSNMYTALVAIQANTASTATNTKGTDEKIDELLGIFRDLTLVGSPTKLNIR